MSVVDSAESDGLKNIDQSLADFHQDDEDKTGKSKSSSKGLSYTIISINHYGIDQNYCGSKRFISRPL